ncbi:diaminopimelate decarboxylase [Limisalsivibrio acetivorans]|uniref:diaminopimelate decarboxylase n=1 Tax=Limisalsivibrio acetivorans TaxID=1304888 RepID=UPI0003B42835|nr:diaminopimelate decarboxylase [Limisalsivibrio acetivorans]
MEYFPYENGALQCEGVSLEKIAEEVGTPFYVYSAGYLRERYREFYDSFEGCERIVCFAVKANSNLGVLGMLASEGCGADIVSGGELHRALEAGIDPKKIAYAGVGKTEDEMEFAINSGILMFNIESRQELDVLNKVAGRLGKKAPIAIRVNPNVDPKTHPYISTGLKKNKFGLPVEGVMDDYRYAAKLENIEVVGAHCHIGSQLTQVDPFVDATRIMVKLIRDLRKEDINIKYLDFGGGLGITYDDEVPPSMKDYAEALKKEIEGEGLTLVFEPGRSIAGNSGALVTKVLYTKQTEMKHFKIVDAAMNDLSRPTLYDAYHKIVSVKEKVEGKVTADVVGTICETGDFLAKDRELPDVQPGGYYAVLSAGAYGMTMASNYNSRPRAAEVLVDGDSYFIVRRRETYEDLTGPESIPAKYTK